MGFVSSGAAADAYSALQAAETLSYLHTWYLSTDFKEPGYEEFHRLVGRMQRLCAGSELKLLAALNDISKGLFMAEVIETVHPSELNHIGFEVQVNILFAVEHESIL